MENKFCYDRPAFVTEFSGILASLGLKIIKDTAQLRRWEFKKKTGFLWVTLYYGKRNIHIKSSAPLVNICVCDCLYDAHDEADTAISRIKANLI